jgi:hypothetical protein
MDVSRTGCPVGKRLGAYSVHFTLNMALRGAP